jgi:hypothetical protein
MFGTLADEVWVATALLHRENPGRSDFEVSEIRAKVIELDPASAAAPGLNTHLSSHCIASKTRHGVNVRMLTDTRHGRRRLYREGDPVHPSRKEGKVTPRADELPAEFRPLLHWYESTFNPATPRSASTDDRLKMLNRIIGSIPDDDLRRMSLAIEEGCERIDEPA